MPSGPNLLLPSQLRWVHGRSSSTGTAHALLISLSLQMCRNLAMGSAGIAAILKETFHVLSVFLGVRVRLPFRKRLSIWEFLTLFTSSVSLPSASSSSILARWWRRAVKERMESHGCVQAMVLCAILLGSMSRIEQDQGKKLVYLRSCFALLVAGFCYLCMSTGNGIFFLKPIGLWHVSSAARPDRLLFAGGTGPATSWAFR